MSSSDLPGTDTPTLEVRAYRAGSLLARELCDSEEDARIAVERWCELEGVTCEVGSVTHPAPDPEDGEPLVDLGDELEGP